MARRCRDDLSAVRPLPINAFSTNIQRAVALDLQQCQLVRVTRRPGAVKGSYPFEIVTQHRMRCRLTPVVAEPEAVMRRVAWINQIAAIWLILFVVFVLGDSATAVMIASDGLVGLVLLVCSWRVLAERRAMLGASWLQIVCGGWLLI